MVIKDEENVKLVRNVGVVWMIIVYIGVFLIGWIGIVIFGLSGFVD